MPDEQIKKELIIIDALLKNKKFSFSMAEELYMAYGGGEHRPFVTTDENTAVINKTFGEEKIAINLAGFYAVECGIGLLCEQTKSTPIRWLTKFANQTADMEAVLILDCFADATWKAGQPFGSLERIKRHNFTGPLYLPAEEIEKDHKQVTAAASFLLSNMQQVADSPMQDQMLLLKTLLQDTDFAVSISKHLDAAYDINHCQPVSVFVTNADESTIIHKSVREHKIAINIAGFYALECGINYLVSTKNIIPSHILKSIANSTICEADKSLLLRLANATWKAGQPFRDLKRITRDTFTPFYFLTREEVEKDMVQIKTAASKLLLAIEENG